EGIVKVVAPGEIYTGTVKRIEKFGAFVEILPNKEGLVHISQLAHERVKRVEDVVKIGDRIQVVVTEIDSMGRINLSRKALLKPVPAAASGRRRRRPLRGGAVRSASRSFRGVPQLHVPSGKMACKLATI